MEQTKNRITWWQYAYYLVLIFIITSWTASTAPPMALRLTFMAAVFVVPVICHVDLLPAVLSCFFIISSYGFSYSYMPSTYSLYCIPIIIVLLIYGKKKARCFSVPKIVVFLCAYSLMINLVTSGVVQNLSYCMFILASFVAFSDTKTDMDIKTFAVFLAIATLVLGFYYFSTGTEFTNTYAESAGLERTGWMDSNYFSTTIGFSALVSIAMLISQKNNLIETVLFSANTILSVIVMVLVASRGGILSLSAGACILLFSSKIKLRYKLFFAILLAAFVIYLFNNDYFALLQYRIEMDETGGSGRTGIWRMKLSEFYASSPLAWIFGMGFWNGTYLGGNVTNYSCFHNDYISYLVCYGIIGFVSYLLFLTYPIRNSNRKHPICPVIIALVFYLATVSLTLEPMSSGLLNFFCYYYYILLLMQYSRTDCLEHS